MSWFTQGTDERVSGLARELYATQGELGRLEDEVKALREYLGVEIVRYAARGPKMVAHRRTDIWPDAPVDANRVPSPRQGHKEK